MTGKHDYSFLNGQHIILVRFAGELWIKSPRTRQRMLEILRRNILDILDPKMNSKILRFRGRFLLYSDTPVDHAEVASKIARQVSGVSSVSPALVVQSSVDEIIKVGTTQSLKHIISQSSFAVRTRREGNHEFSSMEIAAAVGAEVLRQTGSGVRVDLENPDFEIYLDVRGPLTFIYDRIFTGIGGLPSYAQGTVLALIKPHYNSLLAAWLMQKRGTKIIPVFFKTGKPFEDEYLSFVKMQFGSPVKIVSLKDTLASFPESPSFCLACELLCEAICKDLAEDLGISIGVAPTSFDFNQEKTSLDALKLLEQGSSRWLMRPIQFGYLGEVLKSHIQDNTACCLYRDKVSLEVSENFDHEQLDEVIGLKTRLVSH
ncbi:MAG: THUMP domain-containing protein [Candidatus Heimdallarchaeota archaeon]